MRRNVTLTSSILLSLLLILVHVSDDVVRGIDRVGPANLIGVTIFVVWMYGTLELAHRRAGYIIMLLGSMFAAAITLMSGREVHLAGSREKVSLRRLRWSAVAVGLAVVQASCTYGLDDLPDVRPLPSAQVMTYAEYAEAEHEEPYVLQLENGQGSLLYFGSRHTTDPENAQIDSIVTLWNAFQPTVALVESRKARRGSMDAGVKTFGESAVPVSLARDAGIPVYTLEPPLESEIAALLPAWSKQRLTIFYVLRSYTAQPQSRRSDGEARDLIRERGAWPGLDRAIPSLSAMDSIWNVEFPNGPAWRTLPWQATWPTGNESWLNEVSASVNRVRDQYMVAAIADLVGRGERVFAVVGSSHVVMQEAALRELLVPSSRRTHER